jgi:hypothetical protein
MSYASPNVCTMRFLDLCSLFQLCGRAAARYARARTCDAVRNLEKAHVILPSNETLIMLRIVGRTVAKHTVL